MWLLVAHALAQEDVPVGGLHTAGQAFYDRAEQELAAGHPEQAAGYFRMVLGADPAYTPAALGLATALAAAGDSAGAEAVYRSLGTEPDAVEGLARLVEARDPAEALRLWISLQSLRICDPVPYREEARLTVATDPDGALASWRQYQALLLGAEPDGALCLELAAALDAQGRGPDAVTLLSGWLEAFPEGQGAPPIRARLDRIEVERAADALALGGSTPLTAEQNERWREATRRLRDGEVDAAEAVARELVAAAPRAAVARGLYADVLLARGDWTGAEAQAVLARVLAPDDAASHIRLGRLLVDAYGGRRNAEAIAELREAAALRPGDPEVLLVLGRLQMAQGEWEGALLSFDRYLALKPTGSAADEVRGRVEQLRRTPPAPISVPVAAAPRLPEAAGRHYRVALVYLARGRTDEADAALQAALALAPDAPELLNLEARLLRLRGDRAGATAALDRSLAVAPGQGAVLLARGEIAAADQDEAGAIRYFEAAAAAGEGDAHYLLARLAADRGAWDVVRAQLDDWARTASASSLYAPGADALRAEVERRVRQRSWALGLLGSVGLGGPLLWWVRRRTSVTLDGLVRAVPSVGHEVATLCAGLRHEALKHRATVLPDVADALERGDVGPWQSWLGDAVVVRARFEDTVRSLEGLGRRHGLRMDLRARDPILAPMFRALHAASRSRPPSPAALRRYSTALNEVGYAALGNLIQALSVLRVDAPLVDRVYANVCAEPGIKGAALPDLEVTGEGAQVRLYAADLEDILANLLRNALNAGALHLAVRLGVDEDPITGLASARIEVVDDAPGLLTNTMIRGRSISRGLGLAVEQASRHGGTIHVVALPEGRKAVVVSLPAVEAAPVEVEWSA